MAVQTSFVEIPFADVGLVYASNEPSLPPGALTELTNMVIDKDLAVKKSPRVIPEWYAVASLITATEATVWGAHADVNAPDTGRLFWMVTQGAANGRIVLTGNSQFTSLVATLNFTSSGGLRPPVFVDGGAESQGRAKKVFIAQESNAVYVRSATDTTTINTITTPPADWTGTSQPSFLVMHANRLWGGGNGLDLHRMYYSTASDHEEVSATGPGDAGTLAVYPGEGQRLEAGFSLGDYLFLFKSPRGIYQVNTADPTPANWTVKRLTDAVGIAGPRAITAVDYGGGKDVVFLDHGLRLRRLSEIDSSFFGAGEWLADISVGEYFREVVLKYTGVVNTAQLAFNSNRQVLYMAAAGQTNGYGALAVDLSRSTPSVHALSFATAGLTASDGEQVVSVSYVENTADKDVVVGVVRGKSPFSLSTDGYGDIRTLASGGTGVLATGLLAGVIRTAHTDLGYADPKLANVNKRFKSLEIEYIGTANGGTPGDYRLKIFVDNVMVGNETFTVDPDYSGIGNLATGVFTVKRTARRVRKRVRGTGRTFAFQIETTSGSPAVAFTRAFVHFAPSNQSLPHST